MNCKLPDVQARFRIGRGVRHQIANIHWIIEKKNHENSRKTSTSALLTTPKSLCGSQQTVFPGGSVSKESSCNVRDMNSRPPALSPEKYVYRSISNN